MVIPFPIVATERFALYDYGASPARELVAGDARQALSAAAAEATDLLRRARTKDEALEVLDLCEHTARALQAVSRAAIALAESFDFQGDAA